MTALGVAEVEHSVAVHVLEIHRRSLPQEELDDALIALCGARIREKIRLSAEVVTARGGDCWRKEGDHTMVMKGNILLVSTTLLINLL